MTDYVQEPPFCIQIEMTEGCNLRCPFCGLNGIRGKENNFKFMTVELAERIASEIARLGWNCRLEFAMHGEPTMNPDCIEIIGIFRRHLPKANMLMETNGGGMLKDPAAFIQDIMEAGLTTLAIDEYQQVPIAEKIWRKLFNDFDDDFAFLGGRYFAGAQVLNYPDAGPIANPHQRSRGKRIIRVRPIDVSTSGTHSTLSNHCGAGLPKNDSAVGKKCAKPFRELTVRWDGWVTICCNDWRGEMPVANVADTKLDDVWQHERFQAMRKKLYKGDRSSGACVGCDYTSYRIGLLPDKKGKMDLDEPNARDLIVIDEMLAQPLLAEPVLREWEK